MEEWKNIANIEKKREISPGPADQVKTSLFAEPQEGPGEAGIEIWPA